jgi:hypothetical protein
MRKAALLAFVFLTGCSHQPSLTPAQQQELALEQMAAQDDAYCKQQTTQKYADCRNARIAYRQTAAANASANAQMFQAATAAQAVQNAQQAQAMHNLQCMGGTC